MASATLSAVTTTCLYAGDGQQRVKHGAEGVEFYFVTGPSCLTADTKRRGWTRRSGAGVGSYTLQLMVHSYYLNTCDMWTRVVTVTDGIPIMAISTPAAYTSVTQPFGISGWAIDPASGTGTGIDVVDVWAYQNPGSGTPQAF